MRFPVYKESKNNFQKIILTFQHYQTLSHRIFFEWIPGLEVSGEKKRGCVPIGKPIVTFMLPPKRNRHKNHKWFSGHYSQDAGTIGIPYFIFIFVCVVAKV